MTPNVALELSVEQLVDALKKKLFMECSRAQSMMSRTQATKVRLQVLKGSFKC